VSEGVPAPLDGLVGRGCTFEGVLDFEGRVRVDGVVDGAIASADLVEVSPLGRVIGRIEAAQVLVGGEVEGAIVARERCTLLETARVVGDIETAWLDVRAGARWTGAVVVVRPGAEDA
jgi:cytoskeletal protein CcmA (bactofilin family)